MTTNHRAKKWDHPQFQRIRSAKADANILSIQFEDGATAEIESRKILPGEIQQPRWEELRFTPYEIILTTENGELAISWSDIRALTDVEYSLHLAQTAEEQAKEIGRRISQLRKARGMTSKELAALADVSSQSLSRIEHGKHDVAFSTLQKVLAAMGYALKDLAMESETESKVLRPEAEELAVSY